MGKISEFIIRQFKINSFKDVCWLVPKLLIVIFICNELYNDVLYLRCLVIKMQAPHLPLQNFKNEFFRALFKRVVLIIIFYLIYLGITYIQKKGIWKPFIIKLILFQLVISFIATGFGYIEKNWFKTGLLGLYYCDGLYRGRVLEKVSGKPVPDVIIAGIWNFNHFVFIHELSSFADAQETITDRNGYFFLPPARRFCFWPFSTIDIDKFIVFKSGFKVTHMSSRTPFKSSIITLEKTHTAEERLDAWRKSSISDVILCERHKVRKLQRLYLEERKIFFK